MKRDQIVGSSFLHEPQIRGLFDACVRGTGQPLAGIRGKLGSRDQTNSATWELLLLYALLQDGKADYERALPSGQKIDFWFDGDSVQMWLEARYVERPRRRPQSTAEDPVFKAIQEKAKTYKSAPLDAPLVVCLGSADPLAFQLYRRTGEEAPTVVAACSDYPIVAAVMVCELHNEPDLPPLPSDCVPASVLLSPLRTRRKMRKRIYVNSESRPGLTEREQTLLERLDLNHWAYGKAETSDWSLGLPGKVRRSFYASGSEIVGGGSQVKIRIPATALAQLIGGEITSHEFEAQVGDHLPRVVAKALEDGREVTAVSLLEGDPAARRPDHVEITFGETKAPLVRRPKPKRSGG